MDWLGLVNLVSKKEYMFKTYSIHYIEERVKIKRYVKDTDYQFK